MLFSLFESHTERRRKDRTLVVPTIVAHRRVFGSVLPRLLAADRGFWSSANQRAPKEAGVKKVCISALGRLGEDQAREQRQRSFRRVQRLRAGCEGRILLYFCAHARVAERQTRWT